MVDLIDRGVIPWPPPNDKCCICHCQEHLRALREPRPSADIPRTKKDDE
jgi:hypothetical protein